MCAGCFVGIKNLGRRWRQVRVEATWLLGHPLNVSVVMELADRPTERSPLRLVASRGVYTWELKERRTATLMGSYLAPTVETEYGPTLASVSHQSHLSARLRQAMPWPAFAVPVDRAIGRRCGPMGNQRGSRWVTHRVTELL
ncbi:hypothetical protein BHM03_00060443 [Ensete ventricosum]|nr:hypothetical protein BHM03_00060443 [Ensete ventricosum]